LGGIIGGRATRAKRGIAEIAADFAKAATDFIEYTNAFLI